MKIKLIIINLIELVFLIFVMNIDPVYKIIGMSNKQLFNNNY